MKINPVGIFFAYLAAVACAAAGLIFLASNVMHFADGLWFSRLFGSFVGGGLVWASWVVGKFIRDVSKGSRSRMDIRPK